MSDSIFWIIVAMTAATYPARLAPMLLLKNIRISKPIVECMQIMPFCILLSMLVIDVYADAEIIRPKLFALAAVLLASYASRNVGVGVLVGVLTYSAIANWL